MKVTFEPKHIKVDLMGLRPLLWDFDLSNEIDVPKSSFSYSQRDGLTLHMKKAKPGLYWKEAFPDDGCSEEYLSRYSEE